MSGSSSPVVAVASAIFVALVSAFLPTVAQAQPVIIVDRAFESVENNPCVAGETVAVTGRFTIFTYARSDGSDGVHLTLRFVTKGKGIAVSGPLQPVKEYVLNSEYVEEMNAPLNGTMEKTIVLNHILLRKAEADGTGDPLLGSGEDFMWKETVHVTTRNGVATADVANGHSRCM